MKTRVNVNLSKLNKFRDVVSQDLRGGGTGPIRKALKQWAYRYRAFSRRRYLKNSKGGGGWPALKKGTIARRRKKSTAILIDTAAMLGGFDPEFTSKPGQVEETIPFGIRVGVGGKGNHPGGISMGELYRIHHFGEGVVPSRTLIVEPDEATIKAMRNDMQRALKEASK